MTLATSPNMSACADCPGRQRIAVIEEKRAIFLKNDMIFPLLKVRPIIWTNQPEEESSNYIIEVLLAVEEHHHVSILGDVCLAFRTNVAFITSCAP
jgi:hypothetical protein